MQCPFKKARAQRTHALRVPRMTRMAVGRKPQERLGGGQHLPYGVAKLNSLPEIGG